MDSPDSIVRKSDFSGADGSQTLGAFLDMWLAAARARLAVGTYDDYRDLIERYVRPGLGGRPLAAITPLELQAVFSALADRGLRRTARYAHAVVRAALRQAVRWRLLTANPADGVELPRANRREISALAPEQVCRLLKAFVGRRDHALVMIAVTTGLRPSEYLALRWSDLRGDTLTVQRALARGSKGFKDTKRIRSRRGIRLVETALRFLDAHRKRQAALRRAGGARLQDCELIFPDPAGEPDRTKAVSHRFARVVRAVDGLPRPLRLYDLRHTFATLALAAGVPVKVVSEQLGHASAAFTLDCYGHVLTTMQDVAAEKVERLLFGAP